MNGVGSRQLPGIHPPHTLFILYQHYRNISIIRNWTQYTECGSDDFGSRYVDICFSSLSPYRDYWQMVGMVIRVPN